MEQQENNPSRISRRTNNLSSERPAFGPERANALPAVDVPQLNRDSSADPTPRRQTRAGLGHIHQISVPPVSPRKLLSSRARCKSLVPGNPAIPVGIIFSSVYGEASESGMNYSPLHRLDWAAAYPPSAMRKLSEIFSPTVVVWPPGTDYESGTMRLGPKRWQSLRTYWFAQARWASHLASTPHRSLYYRI